MNNKPVAWIKKKEIGYMEVTKKCGAKDYATNLGLVPEDDDIPLYTHPVKELKCIVKDCENHKNEGGFTGDLCNPCYQFIANGEGVYSQAYRNAKPAELTDEKIQEVAHGFGAIGWMGDTTYEFARAILRKAQEK